MATKGMAITATNYNGEIQNGDKKWFHCARLSNSQFRALNVFALNSIISVSDAGVNNDFCNYQLMLR